MSIEKNRAIVRRFYEELSKGEMAAADELIADNIVDHDQNPETAVRGPKSWQRVAASLCASLAGLCFQVEDMIAEGDRVAVRWTMRGIHVGVFLGVPGTGKFITGSGMHFFRLAGGKIVEVWVQRDGLGMMRQLGLFPATGDGEEQHEV